MSARSRTVGPVTVGEDPDDAGAAHPVVHAEAGLP